MSENAVLNPLTNYAPVVAQPSAPTGLVQIEQQRAVAEVQARMMIARANPRDQVRCVDSILQDCMRPSLAESAIYQYSRGGSDIAGPSIRLAEAIARRWGNIASGIKEMSRGQGYSECIAYAWDLETGYYDERQFQVRHWRDTKQGGYPIKDERDIYELVANMGQRRKRAVLLSVIPGDIVDAAVKQCETTLKTRAEVTPERLRSLVEKFGEFNVTQQQLEKRIGRHLDAVTPALLVQLGKIYNSLRDGMSAAADWFDPSAAPAEAVDGGKATPPAAGNERVKAALRRKQEAEQKAAAAPAAPDADPTRDIPDQDGTLQFTLVDAIAALAGFSDIDSMSVWADNLPGLITGDERFAAGFRKRLDEIKAGM